LLAVGLQVFGLPVEPPQLLADAVTGDGLDPGREVAAELILAQVGVGVHEHLLEQFPGRLEVLQGGRDDAPEGLLEGPEDVREGFDLPGSHPPHQLIDVGHSGSPPTECRRRRFLTGIGR
jgi:hypothetical protein